MGARGDDADSNNEVKAGIVARGKEKGIRLLMIEYRNLYKAFDTPVLAGVSLTVRTGERIAIVGPSGTGKSVLLKTTIGLVVPDCGEVLIDGESVFRQKRAGLANVRRKVGYVFQNAALFDSLTVFENIVQGLPEDYLKTLRIEEQVKRVSISLEEVNLNPEHIMLKLPSELSGGMRKRVGLARALIGRPEILLYDEPVTGLDPVNLAAVSHLIVSIAKRTRVTSVLVTHDVEGALDLSDRIALLDSGRIRFEGTPEEFRKSNEPMVRAFADRQVAANAAMEMMQGQTL